MNIKTIDETAIYSEELSAGKLPRYESATVHSQTTDIVETNHTKKRYEQRKWGRESLNTDPNRRDKIISHITDMYERFHEYKKLVPNQPTHTSVNRNGLK